MPVEIFDQWFPVPASGKRILKSKLVRAFGGLPDTRNPERWLERKIIGLSMPIVTGTNGLLLNGLMHYVESTDFDGMAQGTVINSWSDKSGNRNNWVNSSYTGLDPFVDTTRLANGHVTVRFPNNANPSDAPISRFSSTSLWLPPASSLAGLEVMTVHKLDLDPPTSGQDKFAGPVFRFNEVATTSGLEVSHQPYWDGNFYEMFAQNGRPSFGNPVTSTATAFCCYDIGISASGKDAQAWINSENFYSTNSNTFVTRGVETIYHLGGGGADAEDVSPNTWQIVGNLAALYLYNHKLSPAERTVQRAYISNKWGVLFP